MTTVSITYRQHLVPLIEKAALAGLIRSIEIVPSRYLVPEGPALLATRLGELGLPYSFHFTHSSVASADFATNSRCEETRDLIAAFRPTLVSDHLTCARSGDLDLEMNLPIVAHEDALDVYTANVRLFVERLACNVPILLEHVPEYYTFAMSTMSYGQLYARLVRDTGVGVLLDLHNLYCDEMNGGERGEAFMERLPADRILEIHVAGGHALPDQGGYVDGHDHDVPERVFELLAHALTLSTPRVIVLEREGRFFELDTVLRDLETLNTIVARVRGPSLADFAHEA